MRAKQFLIEYDIKKKLGNKILDMFKKEPTNYQTNVLRFTPDWEDPNTGPKVLDELIKKFEGMDPTANKQYAPWLAKVYVSQPVYSNGRFATKIEDMDASAPAYLEKYNKLKQRNMLRVPRNNIYFFDDYPNFMTVMDEYPDPSQQAAIPKGESKVVYSDDRVTVIQPANEEAACYYGQGTRWCTASTKGRNYFKDYNASGPLYILIPKKPSYIGEKYQVQFTDTQIKDERNESFSLEELFNLFPGFIQWAKSSVPEAKHLLIFVSNELINELTKIVGLQVKKYVNDIINDMENDDDEYHAWQVKEAEERGYVTDEGDIDWDKVGEDPDLNNYLRYSDNALVLDNGAEEFLTVKAPDVRYIASMEDEGYPPTVGDLVDAYSIVAKEYISSAIGSKVLHNIRIIDKDKSVNFNNNGFKLVGSAGDYNVYAKPARYS